MEKPCVFQGENRFYKCVLCTVFWNKQEKTPILCPLAGKQTQLNIFAQLSLQEVGNFLLFQGELEQAKENKKNMQPPANKMHVVKDCQGDQGPHKLFRKHLISLSFHAIEKGIPYSCSHPSQLLPFWHSKPAVAEPHPHVWELRDGEGTRTHYAKTL